MAIGEGRTKEWLVNLRALPFTSAPFSPRRTRESASLQTPHRSACQSLAIFLPLLGTGSRGTWHPPLGAGSPSRPGEGTPPFPSWVPCSFTLGCEPRWSRANEADRTTSSAKSRDPVLRSPNRGPTTPWLRLEILSIKVMNKNSRWYFCLCTNYFVNCMFNCGPIVNGKLKLCLCEMKLCFPFQQVSQVWPWGTTADALILAVTPKPSVINIP